MITPAEEHRNRNRGRLARAVIVGVAVVTVGCTSACPHTNLDLTLHGGFGYVVNAGFTVDAGFMNSIDTDQCSVTQLGVDLRVDDGDIVSPSKWPSKFDVTNAEITFDGASGPVDLYGATGPHLTTNVANATAA